MTVLPLYNSDQAYQRQIDANAEARKKREVNNDDLQTGVIIDAEYQEIEEPKLISNETSGGDSEI